MYKLASLLLVLIVSGCTWVHMTPEANAVRVVKTPPTSCEKKADITVSVTDNISVYKRNDIKVIDELETLARNEAPSVGADTITPAAPHKDGTQTFSAWRCGK